MRQAVLISLLIASAASLTSSSPSSSPSYSPVGFASAAPTNPAPTAIPYSTVWSKSNDLSEGVAFAFSFLYGTQFVLLGGTSEVKFDEYGNTTLVPSDKAYAGTHSKLWQPFPKGNLPLPLWGYFAQQNGLEDLVVTAMSTSQKFASEPYGFVYIADTDDPEDGLVWRKSAPLALSGLATPVRRRAGFFALDDTVTFFGGISSNKTFVRDIVSYNITSKTWRIEATIPTTTTVSSICDCQAQVLGACTVGAICNECETQDSSKGGRRLQIIKLMYDPCTGKVQEPTLLPFADPIISFDTTRVGHFLVSVVGQIIPPPRPPPPSPTDDNSSTTTEELSTANAKLYDSSNDSTTAATTSSEDITTLDPNPTTSMPPHPTHTGPHPTLDPNNYRVMLYMTDLFSYDLFAFSCDNMRPRFGGTLYSEGSAIFYAGGFSDLTKTGFSVAVDTTSVIPSMFVSIDRSSRTYHTGEEIIFTTETFHEGMTVRLALSPFCTFPVPGTPDVAVVPGSPGNGKGTLGNVSYAADNVYLCVSNGVCNQNISQSRKCRTSYSQSNFQSCVMSRCCWVQGACYEFQDGPDSQKYFMLAAPPTPIRIIEPSQPKSDGASGFDRFFKSAGGIVIAVFFFSAIVIVSLIVTLLILSRRRSKANSGATGDEDDEGHALEPSGKYKVIRKLGQGGFGSVFLVKRRSDGKELALKHMICPSADERDYAIKEFQLLHNAQGHEGMIHLEEMLISWGVENIGSLNEENSAVVQVGVDEDVDTRKNKKNKKNKKDDKKKKGNSVLSDDDRNPLLPLLKASSRYVCIVMEYCEEGDLARLMLNNPQYRKGLPEAMIVSFARQICSLLMHLHSRNPPIVHRDLKPENVLLKNKHTQVVLTDFGLAQQLEKSFMTTRAGTLHFIAPECWKKHYTATVDMWSLGCILWACCTGRVTNSTARVMFKDARSPTFEVEINHEMREYSSLLRRVVLGLLRIKIDQRLTAQQALDLLDRWKEDAIVVKRPGEYEDD